MEGAPLPGSGFAQASRTQHYIQQKRSRLFLGVTAARDKGSSLSGQVEDEIFATAEAAMRLVFRVGRGFGGMTRFHSVA